MSSPDTEITLISGSQTAVVSPYGASLRRYFLKRPNGSEWNAVWGYSGASAKRGGQGDVLIPFPGRIKGATYEFGGQVHQLAKNDKDGPNAIHGFLRATLFTTRSVTDSSAEFETEIRDVAGYPFSLRVRVKYSLDDAGLKTAFEILNIGNQAAPVGAGFHPYFCGAEGELADWRVVIPADTYLELESFVPTGRVLPVDATTNDFREGRLVGSTKYNDCLANLKRDTDGWSEAVLESSSGRVSVKMDQTFDYVVIYTGDNIPAPDQRRGFAIEPMTCGPDAFNHPTWGLKVLEPNERFQGRYIIRAR